MTYFPKRLYYIGIETEKSTAKMVGLCRHGSSWRVMQLKERALTPGVKLLDSFPPHAQAVTLLDAKEVFIRSLTLPLTRKRELCAALEFQALSLLPYPAEQALLQYAIQHTEPGKTTLNLLAVKKERIAKHLEELAAYGCAPQVTLTPPLALAALSTYLEVPPFPHLFVSIGEKEVCCALIAEGKLLKSYAFSTTQMLPAEIHKVVLALGQMGKAFVFEKMIVFGRVNEELRQTIERVSGKTVEWPTAPQLGLSQEKLVAYGVALGAAMATASGINFLQKEYTPRLPLPLLKRSLSFFSGSIALLTILVLLWGSLWVSHKKTEVTTRLNSLLQAGDSSQGIDEGISLLQQQLAAKTDPFPLLPTLPSVSEFLRWFTSLPSSAQINLSHVHYALVKHPNATRRHEHYAVKVSLEFIPQEGSAVKRLIEALEEDLGWVDGEQGILCIPIKEGKQELSFFLKDKTRYS